MNRWYSVSAFTGALVAFLACRADAIQLPQKGKTAVIEEQAAVAVKDTEKADAAKGDTSVKGQITDLAGAALPGVQVTAVLKDKDCACKSCGNPVKCDCCPASVSTTTNDRGDYNLRLGPGRYEITVSMSGFASKTEAVDLKEARSREVDMTIQ